MASELTFRGLNIREIRGAAAWECGERIATLQRWVDFAPKCLNDPKPPTPPRSSPNHRMRLESPCFNARSTWRAMLSLVGLGLTLAPGARSQEKPALTPPPDVLSLLENHCVQCHGGEKTKAGLDLTTREDLLLGGVDGAAVISGQPEKSLLYRMVTHEEDPGMPHKEDKLPDAAIQQFAEWIRAGVPYSRPLNKVAPAAATATRKEFAITNADRAHWAFQPVKPITPPAVKNRAWPRTSVDAFILAAQEAKGLTPTESASREALIRRATFDLIGLPPTPAEIDAFVKDSSAKAYEALIDRLLASPHYGERWARHWLDLARFAESDGFEHDADRPNAWRYRDYVVRAFNTDKPYDRFIREQLAGDELFPNEPDAVIATGFNLLGPDMVDSSDVIQRRRNTLNDMTDTTALTFLGLTMGCARCHDHKFEPIAQRDYYSLQAFFAPARFHTDLLVGTEAERTKYENALAVYQGQTKELRAQIAALEEPSRKKVFDRKLSRISVEAQVAHQTPKEKRDGEQENLVQGTAGLVAVSDKEVLNALSKTERARHDELLQALGRFAKPTLPATLALQNGEPVKSHVLFRGDYAQPGDEVFAAFPQILADPDAPKTPPPAAVGSYRAPFANWLARPDHPLTARVMVNRLWQHHFGRGLVPTPSDFGTHGQKPTHPELLDWLAGEFVAGGWSIKQLHRIILRSATYRQSTVVGADHLSSDPDNRFYSRMNKLRLEGEAIRDSLLAVSGELNPTLGGPSVFPPIPREIFQGAAGWTTNTDPREYSRRSLYIFGRRNLRFPFLEVFDAPDNNLSCPSRDRSTTAPQSLTLLNADEVLHAAERTAQRLEREADSPEARIALAYRLIIGRAPTASEKNLSTEFLARSPLNELCRVLFNLNSFVYVE
ncbi:MAG: DUF1553 domain-containing protein [Opitutus sp.]|nr:DUF1553 domain-containing protein [Opitutus sp.]